MESINYNSLKQKNISISMYIIIFFLIYLSSSFFALSLPGYINIILSLCVLGYWIIPRLKKIEFNLHALAFFLIICISSILTMIFNSDGIYNYIIFLMYFTIAYLVYASIDLKDFILVFNKIMYFLCFFSLVTFLTSIIFPSIIELFPVVSNSAGLNVHNLLFSVVNNNSIFSMNYGVFWEPGAFQTFINLALFFQIFILKDLKLKYIFIYCITIFTTFSSTGYIAVALLFVAFLMSNKSAIKSEIVKRKKMFVWLVILLIVGIVSFNYLPDIIKFKVFGKLEAILNPDLQASNSSYGSTTIRIDSIIYPMQMAINNPVFGVGFSNLYQNAIDIGFRLVTSTPVNWFAIFGVPIGLLFNIVLIKWTNLVDDGLIIKFVLSIFLLIIIISENYNRNMFYLLFLLYSFDIRLLKESFNPRYTTMKGR